MHEDASEEEVEVDENVRSRMTHHGVSSSEHWWYHPMALFGHPHLHLIFLIEGIDTEIMCLLSKFLIPGKSGVTEGNVEERSPEEKDVWGHVFTEYD